MACCFVGIDLGTSRSGYTYAFSTEPGTIKYPPQYTRDDLYGAPKTDTALLFEVLGPGDWRLDCWGTTAVDKFTEAQAHEAHGSSYTYRLITGKQFKLALADGADQLPHEYKLPLDCPYNAPQLISLMLQCLRDHAANLLQQTVGVDVTKTDVHYCLSVPAGWSLKAKSIMRHAAEQAGMRLPACTQQQRDVDRDQDQASAVDPASAVVLVHEQEAASLTACCDPCRDMPGLKAVPGMIWVILDAGGGTVDIAMHRIEAGKRPGESQLSEVLRAVCLLKGSTMLDQQAEELLLKPLFGSKPGEYERWKQEDPQGYTSQMKEWELLKIAFDGENMQHLKLEFGLVERLPHGYNTPGIHRGRLRIEASAMRQLVFEPVLQPILDALSWMLGKPRQSDGSVGADVLIMAGGFGSSLYLRKRVKEVCGQWLKHDPLTPANAGRAVMLGNTIHLQRPDAIAARVCRLSYGVNVAANPQQVCYKVGQVVKDSKGRSWCHTHFWPLVGINDVVKLGDKTEPFTVYPMPGADSVCVPIYATEHVAPQHITEAGMQQVGVVHVDVKKKASVDLGWLKMGKMSTDNYKIELTFKFGTAELQVKAYDVTNKRWVHTNVTFSNEASASGPVPLPAV